MKNSAFLINVARGGIINEADLASIINEKKIAGAAIDVFKTEPIELENPLLKLKNVAAMISIGLKMHYSHVNIILNSLMFRLFVLRKLTI